MSYIFESISKNDRKKLINDAQHDGARHRVLEYVSRGDGHLFPEKWAIDRMRNYYLYITPSIVREDFMKTRLSFFYEGKLYDVFVPMMFGNTVDIKTSLELFDTLQVEIASALSVFGRGGNGVPSMDEPIDPNFKRVE